MKRENGFYWVKYEGEWQPAWFCMKSWWLVGTDYEYVCEDFEKIGPRIEKPESLDD